MFDFLRSDSMGVAELRMLTTKALGWLLGCQVKASTDVSR